MTIFGKEIIRCETCKYEEYGKCRRYPPIPNAFFDENFDTTEFIWPPVNRATDWCGEHTEKNR